MTTGLSVSRLINVDVVLTPQAAQFANFNSLLILTDDDAIDVVTRMQEYNSITEVAEVFGTSSPAYEAALLWFGQSPQPDNVFIGRWARTASNGQLFGGAADQTIATWTAITDGGFNISIDGGAAQQLDALNFGAVTNMNGIAAVIDAALTGAGCVWDALNERFVITSDTTGATSTVGFAAAPTATATDISILMACRSTSSGAYQADGIAAETPVACVQIFDNQFAAQWYGVTFAASTQPTNDQYVAVAAYIEAANPPHFLGCTTQEAGALSAVSTTDLPYLLAALGYKKTATQYSSSSAYAVCSLLSRILTTNWNANNSTITLMYKQEPGVEAELLTASEATVLQEKNCNVFVQYNNDTAIIQYGTVASGDFIDTVIGADWLANQIQTEVYNLLYTSSTKIPQTDAGNQLLGTAVSNACARGVNNGFLAPGVWNASGFGQLKQGDFLDKGFYVYVPPISSQSQADREARKSVAIQVAAKLAGAVHTVDIVVNVNR